ncbi:MAG: CRISPR-associated endoribonuclease Cas6 [Cuniculiplasma sp.]
MHLIINLDADNYEMPYNHSYQLYSAILSKLEKHNPSLSGKLHNYNSRMKFSLSQLMPGGKRKFTNGGFYGERFVFIISSLDDKFIEELKTNFSTFGSLEIFKHTFKIYSIRTVEVSPSSEIINVKSRSPVILKVNNKYLSNESETQVLDALMSNLRGKFLKVYGTNLNVRFVQVLNIKRKIVEVKGTKLPAFMLMVMLSAELDVLKFILSVGFGSKNQLGFGFVEEEKEFVLNDN